MFPSIMTISSFHPLFILFLLLTCHVIRACKVCLADDCIGFTSPIIQPFYTKTSTYDLTVTTDKPWQLVFVDGTCGLSTIDIQVCTAGNVCINQQLTSNSIISNNYGTMAAAQADPSCANTVRSFVNIGPPVNDGPTIDPTILNYPVNYFVTITLNSLNLLSSSYGFLQILPFFGVSCTFTAGLVDFALVMPWKAYVDQTNGFSLYDVCSSRGMTAYQNANVDLQVVLAAIAATNSCPYTQTMATKSFIFGTNEITDPTSCQLWTVSFSGTTISGLQCAQVPTIYPVICIVPPNYGSLP